MRQLPPAFFALENISEAILAGKVVDGMTEQEVLASRGPPDRTGGTGREVSWHYDVPDLRRTDFVVPFRAGIVTKTILNVW